MREARRVELVAALEAAEAAATMKVDRRVLERTVRGHLTRWRTLLTTHVQDGRQLLREVLAEPLRFTPEGRTYRFEGEAAIGRLLSGTAGLPTFVASPTSNTCFSQREVRRSLRRIA